MQRVAVGLHNFRIVSASRCLVYSQNLAKTDYNQEEKFFSLQIQVNIGKFSVFLRLLFYRSIQTFCWIFTIRSSIRLRNSWYKRQVSANGGGGKGCRDLIYDCSFVRHNFFCFSTLFLLFNHRLMSLMRFYHIYYISIKMHIFLKIQVARVPDFIWFTCVIIYVVFSYSVKPPPAINSLFKLSEKWQLPMLRLIAVWQLAMFSWRAWS